MNKYIDAEKLIAEIEKLRKELPDSIEHLNDEECGFARGQQYELTAIEAEILYLQQEQPEVDLEKEMEEYFKGWTETDEGIACHYQYVDLNTCRGIAHHFYELGLNAKKEE